MNNFTVDEPSSVTRKLAISSEKKDHLEHLRYALDGLIFLFLGVLYICDNSSLLLILRCVNQIVHVQGKPPSTPQLAPTIFVNIICAVTHILSHRATGKRQHGGILVDFVGEIMPGKWKVLTLDVIIFALQLLMLVVGYEKQRASGELQAETPPPQDLESEEAGQLRSRAQEQSAETEEGIEMQGLLPDGADERAPEHQKQGEPTRDDSDDLIVLDMKKGLGVLLRRPMPVITSASVDSPAARASFSSLLARIAAARARN